MQSLEKQLKAVANRRRLAIIKFLHKSAGSSVGDIAAEIKLSFRSTSRHLAVLRAADIVESSQVSQNVFYKLAAPRSSIVSLVLSLG